MSESNIQRLGMLALSKVGIRFWRNNVGKSWVGKVLFRTTMTGLVMVPKDCIVIQNPRPLTAGLCPGSSDLIGIKTIIVTQDMVGKPIGVFCAGEAKDEDGKVTDDQQNFINVINGAGGIAGVFRSAEEALKIFN